MCYGFLRDSRFTEKHVKKKDNVNGHFEGDL